MEIAEDRSAFRQVAAGSFGPAYTVASVPPVMARGPELMMKEMERTGAYGGDPTFHARAMYLFDNGAPSPR